MSETRSSSTDEKSGDSNTDEGDHRLRLSSLPYRRKEECLLPFFASQLLLYPIADIPTPRQKPAEAHTLSAIMFFSNLLVQGDGGGTKQSVIRHHKRAHPWQRGGSNEKIEKDDSV